MKRMLRLCLILLLSKSLAFSPLLYAEQLSLPSGDLIAPEVSHTPDTTPVAAGSNKIIKATVKDNMSIKSVILFYRAKGDQHYKRLNMSRMDNATDQYLVEIVDLARPGIEYYIQATDLAGNTLLHGYAFSPLTINVSPNTNVTEKENELTKMTAIESNEKSNKWLWIGLGVLAAGALAANSSGGGGSNGGTTGKPEDSASVIISAPIP
ncbi:MAG: hypothetical protein GXP08_00125 [Gammaproteobacteria bacterium]|nr:hypothetical protein [Gammaproteobacteria bacterium]